MPDTDPKALRALCRDAAEQAPARWVAGAERDDGTAQVYSPNDGPMRRVVPLAETSGPLARYIAAVSPDVVMAILDRLDAAEQNMRVERQRREACEQQCESLSMSLQDATASAAPDVAGYLAHLRKLRQLHTNLFVAEMNFLRIAVEAGVARAETAERELDEQKRRAEGFKESCVTLTCDRAVILRDQETAERERDAAEDAATAQRDRAKAAERERDEIRNAARALIDAMHTAREAHYVNELAILLGMRERPVVK